VWAQTELRLFEMQRRLERMEQTMQKRDERIQDTLAALTQHLLIPQRESLLPALRKRTGFNAVARESGDGLDIMGMDNHAVQDSVAY
jgi:hypothetical protein